MKISCPALFFVLLISSSGLSRDFDSTTFYLKEFPPDGLKLDKDWTFYPGDNPNYAKYDYNGKDGTPVDPTLLLNQLPIVQRAGIGWFRLKLQVDSSLRNKTIGMMFSLLGAAELYLNGELMYRFGNVSTNYKQEKTQAIHARAFNLKLGSDEQQILSVRYSFHPQNLYVQFGLIPSCLRIVLQSSNENIDQYGLLVKHTYLFYGITLTIELAGAFLTLFFFFSFRPRKEYLFFGIYFLCMFLGILVQSDSLGIGRSSHFSANEVVFIKYLIMLFTFLGSFFVLNANYTLFQTGRSKFYQLLVWYAILSIVAAAFLPGWGGLIATLFYPLSSFEILAVCYRAARRHFRGAWILFLSALVSLLFQAVMIRAMTNNNFELAVMTITVSLLILALGMLIFLAGDFARASSALRRRIAEVEELSKKTLAQEKEKQEILATQKDKLEIEVEERTTALRRSLSDLKSTQAQLIQSAKMASLGELTAGIAHEIQNPLNFVNNFSEVNKEMLEELNTERLKPKAERDEQTEDQIIHDIIANEEKINHHGKRADAIVKGMLQHSQAGTGKKEPTNINALADKYLRLAYHGLHAKDNEFNAEIKTEFDESLSADEAGIGNINIIPQDIGRVLLNVYNNAFYAVGERRKLEGVGYAATVLVSTRKAIDKVDIRVADNGNGIPQKNIDKIFQPFFTTKPTGQGTGLGLSLSYDIIKAHGGEITGETKEGEGSEFIIQLPVNKS